MVIKAVIYTGTAVLQSARGAISVLTSTDPHTGLPGTAQTPEGDGTGNHARRGTAWFEGRLWTLAQQNDGGTYKVFARRYDADGDSWEDAPDTPGHINGGPSYSDSPGSVGLYAFQDALHFFHSYDTSNLATAFIPKLAREYWQTGGTTGTTVKSTTVADSKVYQGSIPLAKPAGERSVSHVLDIEEFDGTIYIATSFSTVAFTPPTGGYTSLEDLRDDIKAVTSIVDTGAPGGIVTVTQPDHGYVTLETITISGADQPEYNGDHVISVVDPDTYTFGVVGTPASPATGIITAQSKGTHSAHRSRSFAKFVASTPNARTRLYLIDNDGKIKRVTSLMPVVADVSSLNSDIPIQAANNRTWFNPGPSPAGVQIGSELYVFFVDTSGVVAYKTADPDSIGAYAVVSGIPAPWDANPNTCVKVITDPSENGANQPDGEVRIMFLDYSTNAFEIYEFDGVTFTNLGSGSGPSYGYTFFDAEAPDVEIEDSSVVDNLAGTVTFTYSVFRQNTASNIVQLEAEYSIDGGTTWNPARAGAGSDGIDEDEEGTIGADPGDELDAHDSLPTKAVTSITRAGSTATVTLNDHGWENGDIVTIYGADQPEYNGDFVISNVAANTFDYTVTGTPATPATGTITAQKTRPHYTFIWKYQDQLGSGLQPNVRFRLRGV